MRVLRKRDLILFLSVLLIAAIGFGVLYLLRGDGDGEWDAVVEYRGEIVVRLPLDVDTEYLFTCEEGQNRIVVSGGAVRVESADCPNQICVEHGTLSPAYADTDFISCAPHHLLIYLEGRE